ncbi:hypothetical protein GCM10023063_49010 [Arthrobacter methylotrophus]|uniref:hypothetical protein n=1 Tax=Arthrobacter methylotrophus TaxID=121291 RepID=UPI0031EA3CB9
MRAKRIPSKVSTAVLGALIVVAAVGCSSEGKGGPAWTAGSDSASPGAPAASGVSTAPPSGAHTDSPSAWRYSFAGGNRRGLEDVLGSGQEGQLRSAK